MSCCCPIDRGAADTRVFRICDAKSHLKGSLMPIWATDCTVQLTKQHTMAQKSPVPNKNYLLRSRTSPARGGGNQTTVYTH